MPVQRVDQLDIQVISEIEVQICKDWRKIAILFSDIFTTRVMDHIDADYKTDIEKASNIMRKLRENAVSLARFYKVLFKAECVTACEIVEKHYDARTKLKDILPKIPKIPRVIPYEQYGQPENQNQDKTACTTLYLKVDEKKNFNKQTIMLNLCTCC